MKICVSSKEPKLDSQVDTKFGRCAVFIIIDSESMEFESVPNKSAKALGGAGVAAVQMIAARDVEAVITGNIGPNAYAALSSGGIKIYAFSRTIRKFTTRTC